MDSNQHSRFLRSRWAAAQLAAAALVVAVVAALSVPSDLGIALTAEHGPVETLQASLLFALAAGVWLHRGREDDARTTYSLAIVLVAMGARELEWHKAAAGGSVLKARFYLGPAAPGAKLLAVVVLLVAAAAVIYLLRRHLREMWVGLRKRRPVAITTATFFVVLLFSRIVDKSFRGSLDPSIIASRQIVEEMLELLLPMLFLLGVFQRSHARDSRETAAALRRARPVPAPARVESVAGSGLHLPLSKTGLSDRQG